MPGAVGPAPNGRTNVLPVSPLALRVADVRRRKSTPTRTCKLGPRGGARARCARNSEPKMPRWRDSTGVRLSAVPSATVRHVRMPLRGRVRKLAHTRPSGYQ